MQQSVPRILFITPVLQHPPVGGPALRIENCIKALARVSRLSVFFRGTPSSMGGAEAVRFYRELCASFETSTRDVAVGGISVFCNRIRRRFCRVLNLKSSACDTREDTENQMLLKRIREIEPDMIWLGFGNISYPLLKFVKEHSMLPVIVDTDSVWSRFILRKLPFAKSDEERAKIMEEGNAKIIEEQWGTHLADLTTAVSEEDALYYRTLAPDPTRIRIFSNVIDPESYFPRPPRPPELPQAYGLIAGTFWKGSPMEHAARWFIDHVLPAVLNLHPEFHVLILGNDSDTVLADIRHPRVAVLGRVQTVVPYLCHAAASLVPLWFESGTRFKILEAGACGIPVVSTTLGAEGIPVMHQQDILLADTPQEFANAIDQLLCFPQLGGRLGSNLKNLVVAGSSVTSLASEADCIIRDILGGMTSESAGTN